MTAPITSWIAQADPALSEHLTPAIAAILTQVAAESKDESSRIYTQAEMVRAIELARSKKK